MMVVDVLDVPAGAMAGAEPLRRYQRFPLEPEFRVAANGTVRIDGLPAAASWRMVMEDDVPRFIGAPDVRLRSLTDSLFEVQMAGLRLTFRVVPDVTPALTWSLELDEVVRALAPGTAGLDVLTDVLLERQHPLGERLRGLPHQRFDDDLWLGDLRFGERAARADLTFERGMVTHAVLRGLEGAERLGLHGLAHLTQAIELVAWEDTAVDAVAAAIDRLTTRSLPWLGSLTIVGLPNAQGSELRRAWREGRWTTRVPAGCQLVTAKPSALALRSSDRADPVPERGFMQVGEGSPLCFVRWRGAVVELTVARPDFSLNGLTRARPSETSPWVVALRPTDVFVVDGKRYQLVTT